MFMKLAFTQLEKKPFNKNKQLSCTPVENKILSMNMSDTNYVNKTLWISHSIIVTLTKKLLEYVF